MGSFRRGLIAAGLCLGPAPAWAQACATVRPGWDGTEVSALGEMLSLLQTPVVLLLILFTAIVIRLRSEWGGVAVVVGWSIATYLVTEWGGGDGMLGAAMAEGCVGSPALFIAVAAAVCIGVVLYTAPLPRRGK